LIINEERDLIKEWQKKSIKVEVLIQPLLEKFISKNTFHDPVEDCAGGVLPVFKGQ